MGKDYHKGVKLQCYISDELSQKLNNYIQNSNRYLQDHDYGKNINKADVVRAALIEYLQRYDINS